MTCRKIVSGIENISVQSQDAAVSQCLEAPHSGIKILIILQCADVSIACRLPVKVVGLPQLAPQRNTSEMKKK